MAEIEHFVHPAHKDHPKFDTVKNLRLNLFPSENQVGDGKMITPTLGEAVERGIINNQTLAYFMARTALFFLRLGIKSEGMRFRQHLKTEMAHYACDCWDAEILMAQGWVECFPADDTRVLTDRGLQFLDEIEARIAAGESVLYACYDASAKQLVYRPGVLVKRAHDGDLVTFEHRNEGAERESANEGRSNHVSLRVTPEHDMYVLRGNYSNTLGGVSWASTRPRGDGGAQGPAIIKDPWKETAGSLLTDDAMACIRLTASAINGSGDARPDDVTALLASSLKLSNTAQVDAFLELFGFWLGDGSLKSTHCRVTFTQRKETDKTLLRKLLPACGLAADEWVEYRNSDNTSTFLVKRADWWEFFWAEYKSEYGGGAGDGGDEKIKSAKWFPTWWRLCSPAQLRTIVNGLRLAGGIAAGDNTIFTSSARFRDELTAVLLHAGYATHFTRDYKKEDVRAYNNSALHDGYRVSYTTHESRSGAEAATPTLYLNTDASKAPYRGTVWCVTVDHPDHLIVAQRAQREHGVVVSASRPIVVGQCVGHADRSAYDLQVHSKATKVDLVAREQLAEPVEEEAVTVKPNKGLIGKTFKGDAAAVTSALEELAQDNARALEFQAALSSAGSVQLSLGSKSVTVTKDMVALTLYVYALLSFVNFSL